MPSLAQKNGSLHIHHFYIDKLKANQERLFGSDPELAQLLDNVAAVLSEHAVALAEDIAEMEYEEG
jgi:dihydropteroate synthase